MINEKGNTMRKIICKEMESNGRVVMWCKEDLTDEKEKSRCWPSGDEE